MKSKSGKKPEKKKEKKKDPVKVKPKPGPLAKREKSKKPTPPKLKLNSMDALIAKALEGEAGLEKLDRLLKMKYEAEAREAKKLFFINFSKMQAELPSIPMDKEVRSKGDKRLYGYASRGQIISTIRQCIADHGFSYHWTEEFPEEKKIKIIFHFTGYGHTETCFIILPIMPRNDFVNDIQQAGSTSTYGKRYTMIDMLGIVAEEDDDGRTSKSKSDPPPASGGMKNVTPDKAPPPAEKKKEPEKQMLPKEITPTTMCDFGALKDAPKAYGKLSLDKLFALRRLAGNPEVLEGVINHVLGKHLDHYKLILKYGTKEMADVVKMITGKDNELDCNSDERYKIMQHLRNIARKLEKEKKDEGS